MLFIFFNFCSGDHFERTICAIFVECNIEDQWFRRICLFKTKFTHKGRPRKTDPVSSSEGILRLCPFVLHRFNIFQLETK